MTLARTLASFGVRCLLVERQPSTTRHPEDGHHQRPLDGAVPPASAWSTSCAPSRCRRRTTSTSPGSRPLTGSRAAPLPLSQRGREAGRDPGEERRHPAARARHAGEPGDDRAGAARRHPRRPAGRGALGRGLRGFRAGRRPASPAPCAWSRPARPRRCAATTSRAATAARRSCARSSASGSTARPTWRIATWSISAPRRATSCRRSASPGTTRAPWARLIAQDDKDTWTLQMRMPTDRQHRSQCGARRLGRPRRLRARDPGRQSLVHQPAAGRPLRPGPRLPRGRFGAPVHPDRRLRHEHRHRRRDRSRLEARRGGEGLCRRGPARVLRARAAAGRLSQSPGLGAPHRRAPQDRRALQERARPRRAGARHRGAGQCRERELGHRVRLSLRRRRAGDPVVYQPTTAPGARLPSIFLRDGWRSTTGSAAGSPCCASATPIRRP